MFFLKYLLIPFVLLFSGCATRLEPGRPLYVYVAENGIVTLRGESLPSGDLPKRMLRMGATPQTRIQLVVQGDVPRSHLNSIVSSCGAAGLPNCSIKEPQRIYILKQKHTGRLPAPPRKTKPVRR